MSRHHPGSLFLPRNSGHIHGRGVVPGGGCERPYVPYTDFAGAPRGYRGKLYHPRHETLVNLVPLVEFATPGLGVLAATGTETLIVYPLIL